MPLRELKKEVHGLPSVEEYVDKFKDNWIKPLRSNTNSHIPFVRKLDGKTQKKLNKKLNKFHSEMNILKNSQIIHDKLKSYSRYLIEMKLTTLNGDKNKSKVITNQLLNDDFLNMKGTIRQVKQFENNVNDLQKDYNEINELLEKHLSLEEAIFFMDLPHKKYMSSLVKTSQKQKKIVRKIGRSFIKLAKETSILKTPHK